MDSRERSIRYRLKNDFIHYAEKCLKIRTKKGDILPLQLNAAQLYIHRLLEEQLNKTGKIRALIVKGRQQGCSTYVEARYFWKVTHRTGCRAFILTHLEDASRALYEMARRFHDNCPDLVRPHISQANAKELVFDVLDSGYRIGTARSQGTGRSHTIQYFHGSEVAYWPQAESHMSGILQAVPDAEGSEVILESTSAGALGLFYQMCMAAQKGESDYQLIFVPWFWQTEYQKPVPNDFVASAEEEDLAQQYNLTKEQLCWRRSKIAELGSVWTFRREYPCSVAEAFHADQPGALWTRQVLQQNRKNKQDIPDMKRIVVAIDPAVKAVSSSDETGIIVAGLGVDGHGYILEDLSGRYRPSDWAQKALGAYYKYGADRIVAEVNQGGDMVEHTLRTIDPDVAYKSVHATRGKVVRAEPVAALDEQGKIHHVGLLTQLEDQMCGFNENVSRHSPDRVDARVWAITELMLSPPKMAAPVVW